LKVPADVKVCRKVAPCASAPESNPGPFDVTVWTSGSLFVQQTLEPVAMLTVGGEKAKPAIDTVVSPG
jgi:hypothetical protein